MIPITNHQFDGIEDSGKESCILYYTPFIHWSYSMAISRAGDQGAIRICRINTELLKKVNKKIAYYLDRLPLESQRDAVALNRLIEEQKRLVSMHIRGHVPYRIAVFNDNERYRASHLRIRFSDSYRRGKSDNLKNNIHL